MTYDIFRIYTRELDDRKKCWIHKRERKITDGNIRNQDPFQWWQKQMQSYHKNMNNNCILIGQNKIEWTNNWTFHFARSFMPMI